MLGPVRTSGIGPDLKASLCRCSCFHGGSRGERHPGVSPHARRLGSQKLVKNNFAVAQEELPLPGVFLPTDWIPQYPATADHLTHALRRPTMAFSPGAPGPTWLAHT